MDLKFVTSTEFQNNAGRFLDEARKIPIGIQKHGHKSHVLLDIDEYNRLKSMDETNARKAKLDALKNESFERFDDVYKELAK
ncbi:type II toxin-antitoxin system Phd/YefM family antitoxin [Hirschia litorea]|uniref:Antitoxin n=1 Tax=Hirschia litorea TaxID=1199156 RepID=A0ABW2IPI3_9PROT